MGPLSAFDTYEKFEAAVKEQIKYITRLSGTATVISQRVQRELAPKPLMSIMYEGCMENGRDVSAGGAMYNFGPGVVWSGALPHTRIPWRQSASWFMTIKIHAGRTQRSPESGFRGL